MGKWLWGLRNRPANALLVFLYLFSYQTVAQSEFYRHYGVAEGLPSSTVYHVMQDAKGYLWFSTGRGVSRYNGYEFTNYTTANGLVDNTIFESIEDFKHRIWFRSFSGKLSYFYNDSIYQLSNNVEISKALNGSLATMLYIDSTDQVDITAYPLKDVITFSLSRPRQLRLIRVPNGYFGVKDHNAQKLVRLFSIEGLVKKDYDNYNVTLLDFKNPIFKVNAAHWKSCFGRQKNNPSTSSAKGIAIDPQHFAIGMYNTFLVVDSAHVYQEKPMKGMITDLRFDSSNRLWITGLGQEPLIYEHGKLHSDPLLSYLSDKEISALAFDREGGVWFSSLKSGAFYLRSLAVQPVAAHLSKGEDRLSIVAIDSSGTIFTSRGDNTLYVLKGDSVYKTIVLPPVKGIAEEISNIGVFPDKTVRLATNNGLSVFENSLNFQRIGFIANASTIIPQYHLRSAFSPAWIAGMRHILQLEGQPPMVKVARNIPFSQRCFALAPVSEAECWVGTINGLYHIGGDEIRFEGEKYPVLQNRIGNLWLDVRKSLWMTTQNAGILVKRGDSTVHFSAASGLLSDFCKGLYLDEKGHCWVGSNKGLSRISYTIEKSLLPKITSIDNFNGPGVGEIRQITSDGKFIYFTNSNGLHRFLESEMINSHNAPPLYLKEILVNNLPVRTGSKHLELKYWQNYLAFNFEALSYKSNFPLAYRYKLAGIDTGWVYTSARNANYPELRPGSFIFEVQVQKSDGNWSASTPSFSIEIAPPLWDLWWVRIVFFILIAGFIYWRVRLLIQRERAKAEISNQLNAMELKTLRNQLNPHFLFNSLSTLSSLIDLRPDQANRFVEELATVYRYTLQYRDREMVELKVEVEYVQAYIYLMQIRFDDTLKIEWSISEKHLLYMLPAHALQLLIENCFKHNSFDQTHPLQIAIATNTSDQLIVQNSLSPKKHKVDSTGLGLSSLEKRYQLLTKRSISVLRTENSFQVTLPLIPAK